MTIAGRGKLETKSAICTYLSIKRHQRQSRLRRVNYPIDGLGENLAITRQEQDLHYLEGRLETNKRGSSRSLV